LKEELNEYRT
jgi:uncharacterized membrane protein YcjF (UPF0283 family)